MEKETEKKTLYEAYTDYIDPATITVSHYLKEPFFPGQENYFECIQQWIEDDIEPNRPLVFRTTPGVGVKTILSHWYQNTLESNSNKVQGMLM